MRYSIDPIFPADGVEIEAMSLDEKTANTQLLLDVVFNGRKDNVRQTAEAANLRNLLMEDMKLLLGDLKLLLDKKTPEAWHSKLHVRIQQHLSIESIFVQIFEADSVNLILNRQSLSYSIQQNDQEPYPFTAQNLADGHASALIIIFELIMRMFAHGRRNNNMQGIVLIDEIDIHLHADLQKIILDSLTTLFPNIQFIVSTHSPFVLSSIENTVICDLESKIVTEAPEYGSIEFKVKYQELKHKARQNSQG